MGVLELTTVTKIYDDAQGREVAVDDISFRVADGEFLVIVGPSGCGKSTTLRAIAGLETITDGTITIDGKEVQDLAPSARNVAMAFQNFALYRNMTVYDNLEYGLKHSTFMTAAEREARVREIADLLEISELFEHLPSEISGGQKQRVALGRALVREPDVFLLDEPLSNLDAKLRSNLRSELQRIHNDFGITVVYVTHDQTEAMALADRIAIMNDAEIQQIAPPEEAYHHPANRFVATFLGSPAMNILETTRRRDGDRVVFSFGDIDVAHLPADEAPETPDVVELGVRPNDVRIHETDGEGRFPVTLDVNEYQGKERYIYFDLRETEVIVRAPSALDAEPGADLWLSVDPADVHLFDHETGDALKTRSLPDADGTEVTAGEAG